MQSHTSVKSHAEKLPGIVATHSIWCNRYPRAICGTVLFFMVLMKLQCYIIYCRHFYKPSLQRMYFSRPLQSPLVYNSTVTVSRINTTNVGQVRKVYYRFCIDFGTRNHYLMRYSLAVTMRLRKLCVLPSEGGNECNSYSVSKFNILCIFGDKAP